jgi:hypothetical protein
MRIPTVTTADRPVRVLPGFPVTPIHWRFIDDDGNTVDVHLPFTVESLYTTVCVYVAEAA